MGRDREGAQAEGRQPATLQPRQLRDQHHFGGGVSRGDRPRGGQARLPGPEVTAPHRRGCRGRWRCHFRRDHRILLFPHLLLPLQHRYLVRLTPYGMPRKVKALDTLRKEKMAIKAKLWKEELLALCLYTVQARLQPSLQNRCLLF